MVQILVNFNKNYFFSGRKIVCHPLMFRTTLHFLLLANLFHNLGVLWPPNIIYFNRHIHAKKKKLNIAPILLVNIYYLSVNELCFWRLK